MKGPLDDFPSQLFVTEIDVDTGSITEAVYTNQLVISERDLEPLTPEQERTAQILAEYWAEKFEKDLMRQLTGGMSEYAQSLRAAKVEPPTDPKPAKWGSWIDLTTIC